MYHAQISWPSSQANFTFCSNPVHVFLLMQSQNHILPCSHGIPNSASPHCCRFGLWPYLLPSFPLCHLSKYVTNLLFKLSATRPFSCRVSSCAISWFKRDMSKFDLQLHLHPHLWPALIFPIIHWPILTMLPLAFILCFCILGCEHTLYLPQPVDPSGCCYRDIYNYVYNLATVIIILILIVCLSALWDRVSLRPQRPYILGMTNT